MAKEKKKERLEKIRQAISNIDKQSKSIGSYNCIVPVLLDKAKVRKAELNSNNVKVCDTYGRSSIKLYKILSIKKANCDVEYEGWSGGRYLKKTKKHPCVEIVQRPYRNKGKPKKSPVNFFDEAERDRFYAAISAARGKLENEYPILFEK